MRWQVGKRRVLRCFPHLTRQPLMDKSQFKKSREISVEIFLLEVGRNMGESWFQRSSWEHVVTVQVCVPIPFASAIWSFKHKQQKWYPNRFVTKRRKQKAYEMGLSCRFVFFFSLLLLLALLYPIFPLLGGCKKRVIIPSSTRPLTLISHAMVDDSQKAAIRRTNPSAKEKGYRYVFRNKYRVKYS